MSRGRLSKQGKYLIFKIFWIVKNTWLKDVYGAMALPQSSYNKHFPHISKEILESLNSICNWENIKFLWPPILSALMLQLGEFVPKIFDLSYQLPSRR